MNLLIDITNKIKVAAIKATDIVNQIDPFKFSPELKPATFSSTLEQQFWADINERFFQANGEFFYELPRPVDAGDTALFQGLATALKILRKADSTKEFEFIHSLFPNGSLIRGYFPDGTPNDTTSNDSATGMLFFFYVAIWFGTEDERMKAVALLRVWANHLKAHNWALCDLMGNPTKYGKLEDGVMTDPLRITLLLGILSLTMLFDDSFKADYHELYNKYLPILAYPKVKLLWKDTDYDTHRAAIHLHVLYQVMRDDVYAEGLFRIWAMSKKTNNAWVYTLCSIVMFHGDGEYVRSVLSTFSYERRLLGNVESLNSESPLTYWPPKFPSWLQFLGTPKERCTYALPFSRRGSQEFFWQRNPFSRDEWVGNKTANVYHSGLDFLLCARLAERLGLIR